MVFSRNSRDKDIVEAFTMDMDASAVETIKLWNMKLKRSHASK